VAATGAAATQQDVAATSPTAAAAIDVTDVRRVWPEVLAAVKRQRRTTQAILEAATVIAVESGVLHLAMPSAVMARRVMEPTNSDLLRAALKEVLGVNWTIRCEGGGSAAVKTGGPPRGSTGGPPSASLSGEPSADPLPPPPPPPEDDDIPDDYGEPVDPQAIGTVVRDPEEIAIALLTTELGARRLDPPA
jgi:DNA polymerase-3 subunit gamma/tau